VFINCPFDAKYAPIRNALVFAVAACGLRPRCALESQNSGQVRFEKIIALIRDCRWGIHDISRTEATRGLPRFNMPFELGLFLGAYRFGNPDQRTKSCLVLDRHQHRYHRYISDFAGHDVVSHRDRPSGAIRAVRNWLSGANGAIALTRLHECFLVDLPAICAQETLRPSELTFTEHAEFVFGWLRARQRSRDF
jgi:hypothetical protein